MHQDQRAFQLSLNTHRIRPETRAKTVLVFGEIQNTRGEIDPDMLLLTAGLLDAGLTLETASPSPNPMAQRIVNFRTPYKFDQSKQFLGRYDYVIVILKSIATPNYRSTTPWRKIKERVRMAQFLKELTMAGRETLLVGNRRDQIKTASIAGDGVKIIKPKNLVAQLVQHITNAPMRPMDINTAQAAVLDHANFHDNDGKLTARKIRRYLTGTNTQDPALITLCDFAQALRGRNISVVKRLLRSPDGEPEATFQTPLPCPALDVATSLDKTNNLPKYAVHLYETLKPHLKVQLNSTDGRLDLMNWYHTQAREHLPVFWVPSIETHTQNSPRSDDSRVDQIAKFLAAPKPNTIKDPNTKALLSKRISSNGPTGLAILLAMLCRIHVSPSTLKNPWASTEISHWFNQSVCAISPEFRRFSGAKTPPPKPTAFAEIIGHPSQNTGLGMNMKMSMQVFDKKQLYCKNRDIDNGFRVSNTTLSNPKRPKRNFILHHVNADRVPMNIMTPQYAHRDDIYHIGYFLWETSQLPSNHHLGIQMVNEVWAPTTFVADLYKQAGATCVTTVGKALHDLPYLEKMAKITPTNPEHFTVFTGFDFHSSVERKNPLAVVKAFQLAFPQALFKHARLIVKTTPCVANHWGDPNGQMAQIRKAAQHDPRIEILEQMLPLQYLFKLMASADCIVSAHRGEGFGYLPAYGLALAKPVIATDWGGVTDFCTHDTSFPVAAPLVDVPKGHSISHAPHAQWADVNPFDLAEKMRTVYHNPAQAKARGRKGQQTVQTLYAPKRLAQTYSDRLKQIGLI